MATKIKKYLRISGYVVSLLGVFLFAGHLWWKFSGDSEWNIVREEENITIYSMKVPGETLMKYKSIMTMDTRLSDFVYYMTTANYGEEKGAIDLYRIEHVESESLVIFYDTYKVDLKPFETREVVLMGQYMQDPDTGVVTIDIVASPNRIPHEEGLTRVDHLSNHWYITPVGAGKIKVETISEMDLEVPYLMFNMIFADVIYESIGHTRNLLQTDTFRGRSAPYIKEPFEPDAILGRH